jgi:hypothetical protein
LRRGAESPPALTVKCGSGIRRNTNKRSNLLTAQTQFSQIRGYGTEGATLPFLLFSPRVFIGLYGFVIDEEVREWLSHDQIMITDSPLGELFLSYSMPVNTGGRSARSEQLDRMPGLIKFIDVLDSG